MKGIAQRPQENEVADVEGGLIEEICMTSEREEGREERRERERGREGIERSGQCGNAFSTSLEKVYT